MSGTITTRPPASHGLPHRAWHVVIAVALALAAAVAVVLLVLAVRDDGGTDLPAVPTVDSPARVGDLSSFPCEPGRIPRPC